MSGSNDFDVELVALPDRAYVVRVSGDLDMATAPALEERVASIDFARRLVIDLTRCTFIDSAAVRALTVVARESGSAGAPVALVATDPGILRVLEITAVDSMLPVHGTLDDAL